MFKFIAAKRRLIAILLALVFMAFMAQDGGYELMIFLFVPAVLIVGTVVGIVMGIIVKLVYAKDWRYFFLVLTKTVLVFLIAGAIEAIIQPIDRLIYLPYNKAAKAEAEKLSRHEILLGEDKSIYFEKDSSTQFGFEDEIYDPEGIKYPINFVYEGKQEMNLKQIQLLFLAYLDHYSIDISRNTNLNGLDASYYISSFSKSMLSFKPFEPPKFCMSWEPDERERPFSLSTIPPSPGYIGFYCLNYDSEQGGLVFRSIAQEAKFTDTAENKQAANEVWEKLKLNLMDPSYLNDLFQRGSL